MPFYSMNLANRTHISPHTLLLSSHNTHKHILDTGIRSIIDKLAEFVARNGPEFESITKAKQQGNPKFGFLFGGDYYQYYQWRVNSEQASKPYIHQVYKTNDYPLTVSYFTTSIIYKYILLEVPPLKTTIYITESTYSFETTRLTLTGTYLVRPQPYWAAGLCSTVGHNAGQSLVERSAADSADPAAAAT